ncbi:phosphatidylglycerophosphatase A [Pseudogracilibacillus auburnensis]|uniref:Phosphatidylglycerophosphatase A n=1 Tax=Pseudogracilibacillus auburnensis TaxID=1494959 RepID=A0A2V3VI09_9BACI|nr:phosphatidylglycerophosphatase A [Pseudogracilibacillus auburnensis]MBO1004996.1 phosphatidylglycerophosphatase A [Pseudogracilibacillus auburnensis]PXW81433.1 phosphatidylglycerophosphatase A [Pseudogracilibacillus auburnensis]
MQEKQSELEIIAREWLENRGVTINDIAELVYYLQSRYFENLNMDVCIHNVNRVLSKREVQHAILSGIQLDELAEKGLLKEPLQDIIRRDEGLYGIDEVIALSIVNVYGSIGFTSYGYIDKQKPGILKKLNEHSDGKVHTFLDDIVGAIAAAASSRLAHSSAGDIIEDKI